MSWNERTLFELTGAKKGAIQTGPFGSQLHSSDYVDQGTPVVMPQDIIDDRISTEKIACVADPMVRKLSKHVLEVGDIVYPRRGVLDKRAFVTSGQEGWLCGTGCIRLRLPNEFLSQRFLFYYLKQPHVVKFIENKAIGATMLNLNTSILESVPVRYPCAKVQTRIADILSAYDDLIENNNRRMALLEEAIHLLYREWFVYLRFPGHERVKVVDGVPEGWSIKTLPEITSAITRGVSPKYDDDSTERAVNQRCIRDGRINLSLARRHKAKVTDLKRLERWDVLVNSTGVGTLGRVAQLTFDAEQLTVDTHITILRPKPNMNSVWFGAAMSAIEPLFTRMGQGATGQTELRRKDLEKVGQIVPSASIQAAFGEIAEPIRSETKLLDEQNQRLREARDLLLPRLMNGSIAV